MTVYIIFMLFPLTFHCQIYIKDTLCQTSNTKLHCIWLITKKLKIAGKRAGKIFNSFFLKKPLLQFPTDTTLLYMLKFLAKNKSVEIFTQSVYNYSSE